MRTEVSTFTSAFSDVAMKIGCKATTVIMVPKCLHRRHLPGGFVPGGGGGEWVPKEKPIKKKIIFSCQKYVES